MKYKDEEKRDSKMVYHFSAILDGLFGVEGAVLSGDALANDASVFVDEDGRRQRGGGVVTALNN